MRRPEPTWQEIAHAFSIGVYLAVVTLVCAAAMGTWGCASVNLSREQGVRVINIATQAANEAEQGILLAYRVRLQKCLADSFTRVDYDVCVSEVDHEYTKIRLDWDALKRTQNDYAEALEKGFYKADEFREWFRQTYCNLVEGLPFEVKLPPVPGLSCANRSNPHADE